MVRVAKVFVNAVFAGLLTEYERNKHYIFEYSVEYSGQAVSLTMPLAKKKYEYATFPPFFDGLLPEGSQLEALLRLAKLDRDDNFGQLLMVGADLVGNVTLEVMT